MTKHAVADTVDWKQWSTGAWWPYDEPVSSFPAWYPESAGVVVEIDSGTTIGSAARAAGANSYPGTDPDNLTASWSGGALVLISGEPYLVVAGGGHGDGAFNGLIKFGPLTGDDPTWTTFLAPSAVGDVRDAVTYSDGRQAANHHYNDLVGVGSTLYSMCTAANYSSANGGSAGFAFTPSGQSSITPNSWANTLGGASVHYDGKIYSHTAASGWDRLQIYDIAEDSWSAESNDDINLAFYVAAAVDTTRGALLLVNGSTGVYWTLPGLARTTGRNAPSNYHQSLEYDPDRDAFISVVSGSLTVRELSASELAAGNNPSWTTRTFTGDTPSAGETAGTYGRFRYVPQLKGYILAPSSESHVYFYRSA